MVGINVKKKIIIIVLVSIALMLGITYAWFSWGSSLADRTNVTITTGEITVTYNGGPDITNIVMIPVSSKEKGVADGVAVYKEITVSSTEPTYFDLNMTLDVFPVGLKHKSVVWEIYENNSILDSGNFSNAQEDDIIKLVEGRAIDSTTTTYKLYIWIDGNQFNPKTIDNQEFTFILNGEATDQNKTALHD